MGSETLLCPWEPASYMIFSSNVPPLLYYSHIPVVIIALALGIFIFANRNKDDKYSNLLTKLLLGVIGLFSLYSFMDIVIWASNRSDFVMFAWSLIILVEVFLFAAATYLSLVFIKKKDVPFSGKLTMALLLTPLILLTPTSFNLVGIDLSWCDAEEGFIARYYSYFLEALFTFWIVIVSVKSFFSSKDVRNKKRAALWGTGMVLFLFAFSWGNIIGTFTGDWDLAQYGLFGMPIFIGFLTYLVVKFKAFNVKLLGTQALVASLWLMMLGILFLRSVDFVRIVILVTLVLVLVAGIALIRSVKNEVAQREKLQKLTDQLEKANRKLRELDQLKSEFLSFASHQLRNPLSAVKGYASLLLEGDYGKLDDEPKKAVSTIFEATDSLVQMVQDFLDVSKIEQGGMKYQKEDVDLKKLINQTVSELEPTAKEKNLALNTHIKEGSYITIADEVKLKQVLINVIDNAIKYTPEGSVDVYLEAKSDWIKISVKDSGVGIDKEDIERLFAKFVRAKDAHHHNTHGSGLGMYLAKMIVEAHHGHIRAESNGTGKGSTFIVELKKAA